MDDASWTCNLMVGPYEFKFVCDRIINAFISSGIIIVIMIKSAGPEHNIYRIIKTLPNQDYLAIDQQKHHFILSQNTHLHQPQPPHLHQPQPHRHQQGSFHLPVPPKQKPSRIITHKDHLVIEESTYYLFETGAAAIVWAKDIPSKHLQSPKFIFDLVK